MAYLGTHCAGTIAGTKNGVGVARKAQWYDFNFLPSPGIEPVIWIFYLFYSSCPCLICLTSFVGLDAERVTKEVHSVARLSKNVVNGSVCPFYLINVSELYNIEY